MSSDLACYTFTPPQTGPFSLVIPPTTYCAGSDVEGEVLLKFPQVQDEQIDEVIVELRGKLKVSVLVLHSGGQRVSSVERQELVFLKQSLWTRGSAYPPPDSHVLRLPFCFHLPSDPKILPSVCWDQAVITYYVEAIALRPRAFFTSDKRVRKGLAVVSRGDPALCASIRSLREVQGGPTWKTVHREKRVRRGIWGEHSTARVEVRLTFRLPRHGEMPVRPSPSLTAPPSCTVPPQLLIPNQHGILPRCLDVPILIKIKTTTARLARAKADRHPEGKPIFPSLGLESDSNNNNSDSTGVDVRMRQTFTVRVGGITDSRTTETVLLHIKQHDLLPSSSSSSSYYLQWEDDVRAGDREVMGRWVQRWTLQPTVKLGRFPPTFECDSVDCAYTMRVEVPFPGMGNSIHVSMPVTLDSGIDQAVPIKGGGTRAARRRQATTTTTTTTTDTSSGGGTEVPRDVEPPNLPPTYFDAVYRDGEVVSEGDGVRDTGTHPPRYNDQG